MDVWRSLAELKRRLEELHPKRALATDEENVYLGKTYGLPALSIAQWRLRENDPSPEIGWGDPRLGRFNEYHVVVLQSSEIVNHWSGTILEKIRSAEIIIGYAEC